MIPEEDGPFFWLAWLLAIVVCVGWISYALGDDMIAPTPEEAADIANWIPSICCRTNNCCRKVHPSALTGLPNNRVRVEATGQVLPRTGWSQDKNTWRCACDLIDGRWVVHPAAHTRCVFDHPQGY